MGLQVHPSSRFNPKPLTSFNHVVNPKPLTFDLSTYLECLSLLPQVMKIQGQLKSEHGKGKVLDPSSQTASVF